MKRIALILLLAVALPALADRLPLPADTPASYAAECGSCHLAYPPALLAAGDWRRVMAGLDDHFGTDAAVDARKRQEISTFLERHAGNAGKLGSAGDSAAHQHDRPFCPQAPRSADRSSGTIRASNRRPIAKPAIAAPPTAITANTTSPFAN